MNKDDFVHELLKHQHESGRFRSFVTRAGATSEDANGFSTALVLREFRRRFGVAGYPRAFDKAFDYLQRCRDAGQADTYRFWPTEDDPVWCDDLVADADDTAVILVEQYAYGKISRETLRAAVCASLPNFRLRRVDPPAPAWLISGAFMTMFSHSRAANPTDCCVNANVLAALATADLKTIAGYREACEMIALAIEWAGNDRNRALATTPYYANPGELFYALTHAVECGAYELEPARALLAQRPWNQRPDADSDTPVYGQPGCVCWTSPALQFVRFSHPGCNDLRPAIGEFCDG